MRNLTRNHIQNNQDDQSKPSNLFVSFPWESDLQILNRFAEQHITTFEEMANIIANYWINFGAKQLINFGCYPKRLDEFALIQFEDYSRDLMEMKRLTQSHAETVLHLNEVKHEMCQIIRAFEHSKELQKVWIKIQFPDFEFNA